MMKSKSTFLLSALTCATLLAPKVTTADEWQLTDEKQQELKRMQSEYDYPVIVKAYVEFMIEHGRDRYGEEHSPLFVSTMDRTTATVFQYGESVWKTELPSPYVVTKPYAPGLRREHKMRPTDRTYSGANPLEDLPLYGLLYRINELTGDKRYAREADKSVAWFLENGWSSKTKLPGWGSHMYYDVHKDQPVFAATGKPDDGYGAHEYNYVWPYWEQTPEALKRFARELWNQHINNKETGHFNRHSTAGGGGMEFPQTGSCYMDAWAREYGRSGDPEMKAHIETLLKLYRSMRHPETGAMSWCTSNAPVRRENSNIKMNLFMATTLQDAAAHVEKRDPELAEEMREFVRFMDDEYLSNDYDKILDVAGKGILTWYRIKDRQPFGLQNPPDGVDGAIGYPLQTPDGRPAASLTYLTPWFPGRSYAEFSMLLRDRYERCEEKHRATYRRALLDAADIYMSIGPEVGYAQYPDNIADVVALLRYVYKLTDNVAYLHRADQIMRLGVKLFFDDTSPLPKITHFDNWYESSLKNASSVEILRQMLELSLDLEALPEGRRAAPRVDAAERDGLWHARLDDLTNDLIVRHGPEREHSLYLSTTETDGVRHLRLSDIILRIPAPEESDKQTRRRIEKTKGKVKDAPRHVKLIIRNTGKQAVRAAATATFHDTYHDNGRATKEKLLKPGESAAFVLTAPELKWIRRLAVSGGDNSADLRLEEIAFAMVPPPFSDAVPKLISDGLVLHLSGNALGDVAAGNAVGAWKNQVAPALVATAEGDRRPTLIRKDGRAFLRFDGKNDALRIADADVLDIRAWTMVALVRVKGEPGVILSNADERNQMINYRVQLGPGVGVLVQAGPKQHVARVAKVDVLNHFSVITARFDPTADGADKITIHADGVPASYSYQKATEGELADYTHDGPLFIGCQPGREPRHFKGDIADILLYNRALSEDEMQAIGCLLFENTHK